MSSLPGSSNTTASEQLMRSELRQSERQLNIARCVLVLTLFALSILAHRFYYNQNEGLRLYCNLVAAALGGAAALTVFFSTRNNRFPAWLPYVTITSDYLILSGLVILNSLFPHTHQDTLGTANDRIFLFFLVVGASSGLRLNPKVGIYSAICAALMTCLLLVYDRMYMQLAIDPFFAIITVAAVGFTSYLAALASAKAHRLIRQTGVLERERQRIKNIFERYVSATVADTLLGSDVTGYKAGVRRDVTIMFCDIRDFTSMSEVMSPEDVVDFLNSYFGYMVKAIFRHHGTVDKYIGDGIMAIFGAPAADVHHAQSAVLAALEMRQALKDFNSSRRRAGKQDIRFGVGLHTGECVVGTIGTEQRQEFTAVGDVVNVASRIESLTKAADVDILASRAVLDRAPDLVTTKDIPPMQIRGKSHPVRIAAIVGLLDKNSEINDAACYSGTKDSNNRLSAEAER